MSIYQAPTAVRPSYKQGFARNAAEAKYPQLWDELLFAIHAGLGHTGISTIPNWGKKGGDGVITALTVPADFYRIGQQGPEWNPGGDLTWGVDWPETAAETLWTTTDSFTIAIVIKHLQDGVFNYLFNSGNAAPSTEDLHIRVNADKYQFYLDGGIRAQSTAKTAGKYYLYWLRSIRGSMVQSVVDLADRTEEREAAWTQTANISTHATNGASWFATDNMNFALSDAAVCAYCWDRALSDSELVTIAHNTIAPFERKSRPLIMPIAAAAPPAGLAAGQRAIMVS